MNVTTPASEDVKNEAPLLNDNNSPSSELHFIILGSPPKLVKMNSCTSVDPITRSTSSSLANGNVLVSTDVAPSQRIDLIPGKHVAELKDATKSYLESKKAFEEAKTRGNNAWIAQYGTWMDARTKYIEMKLKLLVYIKESITGVRNVVQGTSPTDLETFRNCHAVMSFMTGNIESISTYEYFPEASWDADLPICSFGSLKSERVVKSSNCSDMGAPRPTVMSDLRYARSSSNDATNSLNHGDVSVEWVLLYLKHALSYMESSVNILRGVLCKI